MAGLALLLGQAPAPAKPCAVLAWPRSLDEAPAVEPATPTAPLSSMPLRFDESDIARIAAGAAVEAAMASRAEAAASAQMMQARALETLARTLAEASRERLAAQAGQAEAAARLVAAVLKAVAATHLHLGGESLVDVVTQLLREAPDAGQATLRVHPAAVEVLRVHLPELAIAAGFSGTLEIEATPELGIDGVQLLWAEGWVEHVPTLIEARIMELLAGHAQASPPGAVTCEGES